MFTRILIKLAARFLARHKLVVSRLDRLQDCLRCIKSAHQAATQETSHFRGFRYRHLARVNIEDAGTFLSIMDAESKNLLKRGEP